MQKVVVVGLGYIGLPIAAIMASRGLEVVGIDVRPDIIETVNSGRAHFIEPELDALLFQSVQYGRLKARMGVEKADAFVIAVPTPLKEDKGADISMVEIAARSIAPELMSGNLVVIESTSPVGTTERISRLLAELRPDLTFPHDAGEESDIRISYCPERILPGAIVQELVETDRIIGGVTARCSRVAAALYATFSAGEIFSTTARTAEMVKLSENAFRDTNIAFANELSLVANALDVDVWEVIALANRHPRVNILSPGPGVGGHCIAVDPWFLIEATPDCSAMMRTARAVNDGKTEWLAEQVEREARAHPDTKVACLGLTYKANVDDLRESPALRIASILANGGRELLVVDPHVSALPKALSDKGVRLVDLETALAECGVLALLVDHREFRAIPRERLTDKALVDAWGIWR